MKSEQVVRAGDFGDQRLSFRHAWLMSRVAKSPDVSFPGLTESESELEAVYRFFGNRRVTYDRLMEPSFRATTEAVAEAGSAIIIHDTTEFRFGGEAEREGLGRVGTKSRGRGFYGHFALAASADGCRRPIGLLGFIPFFLIGPARKRSSQEALVDPDRKSTRWGKLIERTEERLGSRAKLVHVMDREADDYALLEQLVSGRRRFVMRLRYDRYVHNDGSAASARLRARAAMEGVERILTREVPLSGRGHHRGATNRRIHPPRKERVARLHCRAKSVSIVRPSHRADDCVMSSVTVNVVQVYEPVPPQGAESVEWLLVTTEPIETPEQVAAVIDIYRTRWLVEEYFKALKTGCAYEQRQLESSHALLNALGVLAPAAVDLLRIRNIGRDTPETPATEVLTPMQLEVLRVFSKRHRLTASPTAADALLAIAGLGGHIKNNGDPGWLVLHRGYRKMLDLESGWSAAVASRSDQS